MHYFAWRFYVAVFLRVYFVNCLSFHSIVVFILWNILLFHFCCVYFLNFLLRLLCLPFLCRRFAFVIFFVGVGDLIIWLSQISSFFSWCGFHVNESTLPSINAKRYYTSSETVMYLYQHYIFSWYNTSIWL